MVSSCSSFFCCFYFFPLSVAHSLPFLSHITGGWVLWAAATLCVMSPRFSPAFWLVLRYMHTRSLSLFTCESLIFAVGVQWGVVVGFFLSVFGLLLVQSEPHYSVLHRLKYKDEFDLYTSKQQFLLYTQAAPDSPADRNKGIMVFRIEGLCLIFPSSPLSSSSFSVLMPLSIIFR
jgi:hypothetical protein